MPTTLRIPGAYGQYVVVVSDKSVRYRFERRVVAARKGEAHG